MSKKKILSIIIGLVVILSAVSGITYAIATSGKGEQKNIATSVTNYGLGAGYSYTSNIDLIIQNSKKSPMETFNVIEIIPNGQTSSELSKYITEDGEYFKQYVIDANSSNGDTMASNAIRYDAVSVNPTTNLEAEVSSSILGSSTLQELLDAADLIYVSSQYYNSYDGNNNMSEAVYNFLHTYALGSNKPIIMDYVRPTDLPAAGDVTRKYSDLVNLICNNHIRFRTFGWDPELSAEQFFKSQSGSCYLRYPVDRMSTNGTVLVIAKDSTDLSSMYQKMLKYEGGADALRKQAYYGQGILGDALEEDQYTVMTPEEINAGGVEELGGYDFILIEGDVMSETISEDVYNRLRVLSESSKYIIYNSKGVTNNQSSTVPTAANNYLQLMDLLVSNKGVAKYSHVLPVAHGFFSSLYSSAVEASLATGDDADALKKAAIQSAKSIADIIGAGDYRGSLTDGANGRKFRVLEIQPCYPIDLDLAATQGNMENAVIYKQNGLKGNYYTDPGSVLEGKSEDEVDAGTEYYKFELSKAKLVKALGISYQQIELDQMSTEAFISDKNVVLETYDLVYIGGNSSALTPNLYKSPFASGTQQTTAYFPYMMSGYMTAYEMYTHNGTVSGYYVYGNGGYGMAPYGAIADNTVVQTNGNDLTLIKYNELKDYIDAGMPILFSSTVSQAFEQVYNSENRLVQLGNSQIDPDSRMYYILKYAYEKKQADEKLETIVWNMDITSEATEDEDHYNNNNMYGNTLGSYVHLFGKETNADILKAVEAGAERPSFKIVSKPLDYIQGNKSTYSKNLDGTMSITISMNEADIQGNCQAKLYVDQDGNGSFSEEEWVNSTDAPFAYAKDATRTLTYTFPYDDFYGIVSWKIVVMAQTSSGGTVCDMKYGYAYFERQEDQDEKEVKILQIMPVERVQYADSYTGGQDKHSLYLCTECQQAKYLATYNLSSNGDFYANVSGTAQNYGEIANMGLHEHKFGIVKYDTAAKKISNSDIEGAGSEDWDYNFADEIESDYNFDIDILLLDDLKQYTDAIRAGYTIERDTAGNPTKTTSNVITEDPFTKAPLPEGTLAGDYYQAQADYYEGKWEEARIKLERSGIEEKLNTYLREQVEPKAPLYASTNGDLEGVTAEDIEKWIEHEAYNRYFFYYGFYQGGRADWKEYADLYATWVSYHDEVVKNHQLYNRYSCVSYSSEEWLLKNYDIVVLGFAEDFNNKDLTVEECEDIRSYLTNGGTVLLTHDTTTRYKEKDKGSYTLTTELRNAFGLDRYHVNFKDNVYEEDQSPDQLPVTTLKGYSTSNSIYLQIGDDKSTFYGPVVLGKHNVTVDFVLDESQHDITTIDGKTYHKPYHIVSDDQTVANGTPFTITYHFYDTVEDWKDNKLSAEMDGKVAKVGFANKQNSVFVEDWYEGGTVTIAQGSATVKHADAKAEDIQANSPLLYRKFVTEGYTTLPGSTIVDPTKSKYYFTEMSLLGSDGEARTAFDWYLKKMAQVNSVTAAAGTIAPIGATDSAILFDTKWMNSSPYRYAEYNLVDILKYNQGINNTTAGGTTRSSKVNDGIITVYPFKISDELKISATHTQQYALDLEDSNAAVWFTLSGSSYGDKDMSSLFAASPYDGLDNYFLYSYQYGKGTVDYSGAGNTVVTGPGKNNNDERRLYLNVIVNSVRNKGSKPKITVHEKDRANADLQPLEEGESPNTNPYMDNSGNYVYSVNNKDEIPEFDYKVKVNNQTQFADIYVFYDLNYGTDYRYGNAASDVVTGDFSSRYTNNQAHVLIYHYTRLSDEQDKKDKKIRNQLDINGNEQQNIIIGSMRKDLYATGSGDSKVDPLGLKPSYFDPYGGTYTYLVIWARDMDGKTAYKRIKISLVPYLFDLTYNTTIQLPIYHFKENTSSLDMINRTRFNI